MSPMLLPRPIPIVLLMSASLAACSTPPAASGVPSEVPSQAAFGTARPSAIGSVAASPTPGAPENSVLPVAAEPPPIALEEVASSLAAPTSITTTPDGWLLVNERDGRVIAVSADDGRTAVALDIRDRVRGGGEQGLLGLALHPDWPEAERAFVHYSDRNGDTILSEVSAASTASPPSFDPASERILLQVDQPYANHNGGQLAFGPDGMLWIGLGDGGAGGDPEGNGQDPATLLGSILRLDVDARADGAGYGIPGDNPFADGAGGAPEVYLFGLRNPWRFSFDSVTGDLWIADVGQNAHEEVNRIDPVADAGANLGWALMEASHCFVGNCSVDGLVLPLTEYGRDLGCSVTGGHVYRGEAIPDLGGWYLFADYCSGLILGIPSSAEPPDVGEVVEPRLLLESGAQVSSFGEDADGELYIVDLASGTLYRIVAAG